MTTEILEEITDNNYTAIANKIVNLVDSGQEVVASLPDEKALVAFRRAVYRMGNYTIKTRDRRLHIKQRDSSTRRLAEIIKAPVGEYIVPITDRSIISAFVNRNFKGHAYRTKVHDEKSVRVIFGERNQSLKEKISRLSVAELKDLQNYINSIFEA